MSISHMINLVSISTWRTSLTCKEVHFQAVLGSASTKKGKSVQKRREERCKGQTRQRRGVYVTHKMKGSGKGAKQGPSCTMLRFQPPSSVGGSVFKDLVKQHYQ